MKKIMLKRDIGGFWLMSGQDVLLTDKYFSDQTGTILGRDWISGNYFIRMHKTNHVLPFRECELAACG